MSKKYIVLANANHANYSGIVYADVTHGEYAFLDKNYNPIENRELAYRFTIDEAQAVIDQIEELALNTEDAMWISNWRMEEE